MKQSREIKGFQANVFCCRQLSKGKCLLFMLNCQWVFIVVLCLFLLYTRFSVNAKSPLGLLVVSSFYPSVLLPPSLFSAFPLENKASLWSLYSPSLWNLWFFFLYFTCCSSLTRDGGFPVYSLPFIIYSPHKHPDTHKQLLPDTVLTKLATIPIILLIF